MSVTQATFAATLVDEWLRCGVTDAVVCPGSRSTPMALALAARAELRLHVRLDERGAGFFAIGLALATGRPPVLCTTSGTAAVELHPAIVEAHHARVPLIACTADRPPELQGVGAPQTIDQRALYGSSVRWAVDPGVPVEATRHAWRSLAARAVAEATAGPAGPGPVHLNLAFRDPLVALPGPLPDGRARGAPMHQVRHVGPGGTGPEAEVAVDVPATGRPEAGSPGPTTTPAAPAAAWAGRRGVIVAGAGAGPPARVLALAAALGWPVLADPRSGCRTDHPCVVAAADALLRADQVAAALRPDVVLVLGAPWASKVLGNWVAASGAVVDVVDPWWRWVDPHHVVASVDRGEPGRWLAGAHRAVGVPVAARPAANGSEADGWLGRWQSVEAAAQRAIDDALGDGLSEPALARRLYGVLPEGATVVASSSMPVRDLEWFAPPTARPPRVLANRGANGIDGVCSTALGVAAAGTGPAVALVGDLAFLHDVSSLVTPRSVEPPGAGGGPGGAGPGGTAGPGGAGGSPCVLVVVDNGGGGIFDFLPQADALARARFERLFGSPMAVDVAEVAAGFGWAVSEVGDAGSLAGALAASLGAGGGVVRVRVPDRRANVAVHDRVHEAVATAAGAALGAP